jgi:hypothetical protein
MAQAAEEEVEYSTMRTPKDVIRMIGVLATIDGTTISGWCDTTLREFVVKKYRARIRKEGADLGGEG